MGGDVCSPMKKSLTVRLKCAGTLAARYVKLNAAKKSCLVNATCSKPYESQPAITLSLPNPSPALRKGWGRNLIQLSSSPSRPSPNRKRTFQTSGELTQRQRSLYRHPGFAKRSLRRVRGNSLPWLPLTSQLLLMLLESVEYDRLHQLELLLSNTTKLEGCQAS